MASVSVPSSLSRGPINLHVAKSPFSLPIFTQDSSVYLVVEHLPDDVSLFPMQVHSLTAEALKFPKS